METINNIPELIDLIERRKLTSKQICKILSTGFNIFANEDLTPKQLIKDIEKYETKYGNVSEGKPLFLDEDFDVESYLDEQCESNRLWNDYKTTKAAQIASLIRHKGSIVGSNENNTYYLMGRPAVKFTMPHPGNK